jgi:hypothetical protein
MCQVYFGSSIESKLHEGYVFGLDYTFQVELAKVEAPSDPCTNHRLLNEEDAERIYGLVRATNVVRAQISPMILRPKKYIGPDAVQVDFGAEGAKEDFQTLHHAHVRDHGEGHEAREAFLSCFTWEPVDGQHIRSACIDIATKAMEAGTLTAEEYSLVFTKWKAQVVMYNEPQLYVELSRQVCINLNFFWCYLDMWILQLKYRVNQVNHRTCEIN